MQAEELVRKAEELARNAAELARHNGATVISMTDPGAICRTASAVPWYQPSPWAVCSAARIWTQPSVKTSRR